MALHRGPVGDESCDFSEEELLDCPLSTMLLDAETPSPPLSFNSCLLPVLLTLFPHPPAVSRCSEGGRLSIIKS